MVGDGMIRLKPLARAEENLKKHGDFNLVNSHVHGPTVLVEVTMNYREGKELERTQVCTVGNETGWAVTYIVRHVFSLSHDDRVLVDF